jgi:hypothetical protein
MAIIGIYSACITHNRLGFFGAHAVRSGPYCIKAEELIMG